MSKCVPDRVRYEPATKTLRADPENYWLASFDSWDGAVDHEATARKIETAYNNHKALISALVQAIEGAGYLVSGPTDWRAAEHGEPRWVCNARAAIAEARG